MTGRLWVDSSVARKPQTLRELTDLATGRGVEVVVHAHVHLEMCRHLRCAHGDSYNPDMIKEYFRVRRVKVADMRVDEAAADRWSERLYRRYPSTEAWEEAKKGTLGGELRGGFRHEPGHMPMTTDWWVALQVEDQTEDRVAVEDEGEEWRALRAEGRALTADAAKRWLTSLANI